MEALYSPSSQTLTLIPRFSSSSSSVCLCVSRIHSLRTKFFGNSSKFRLNSKRKWKRLRLHTTQAPMASLNSPPFPIVAVIVAAMTVSAAVAAVFSSFYYSKKKIKSAETPSSESNQEEKEAAQRNIESLKEIKHPSLEFGDSVSKDNAGRINLSWKTSLSIAEDTLAVGQVAESNFHEAGAVASALIETREVDLSLQHASSQHLQIESLKEPNYSLPEINLNDNEVGSNLSYQDRSATQEDTQDAESVDFPDSSFHELGAIASALLEKSEEIGLSLPETSPEYLDTETLKHKTHSLSEDGATNLQDNEGWIKLSSQDPSLIPFKTPDDEEAQFPDSNFQNLGANASFVLEKNVNTDLSLELDALQPPVDFTGESDSVNHGVGILSVHEDITKDAVSELVNPAFTEYHLEEANRDHDETERQESSYFDSTKSGRDELYLFYENTFASENPEHLLGINGSSTEASHLAKNNLPVTTTNSALKMLQEDNFQAAGTRGHGPVASQTGGSFHGGKGSQKVRRSLRSDTRAHSLLYDHRSVSDLPDVCALEVDSEHTIHKHMSSYNRLLRSGRLRECVELLEDMDSQDILDMSKIYHAKFFDFCRRQKAVKEALRFTKLIPNPTLSTFNMLMSVCSAAQDSEGAFDVWLLVQKAGYQADCRLYTTLISTCAKCGKVDTMFEVFHGMVNAGVEPNLHTYGALIDGCARAGQVAKAFGVYGILRSKNVKPDRVVFNALITACGQSGAVERAFDVLAEMRSELQPIDPDHFTIGALIRACMSAGQVDKVKGVYDMMEQFSIKGSPELYTIAANSCSQTGDWDFACKVYADMKRKGVIPDEMFFSALIDVAGHAGNLDAAFEVLQDARTEGKNPGIIAYSSLMGACSNTQNWEKALELFEQIKAMNLKPTVSTVNALLTALCDADQLQKALDVLTEMQRLELSPNDITYSILIAASEKKDDLEVGLALFSQAKADGVSFSQIMCKCLIKMCYRRFERASAIGEPVLSFKSGRPQIDSKWASLALKIYREMVGAGLVPSMEMLSQVLGCLQIPKDVSLKKRLTETLGINVETSKTRSANLFPLIDGFAEYDPRAFSMFEEAASLGIVPGASFKESVIVINAENLSIHIAEVYILTVLKGLKHRLAAGAKVPSIVISVPVETTDISRPEGEKTINVSSRLSQVVGALFRRLRLPYQGSESSGKIKITGFAIKKWLQPKFIPSYTGNQIQVQSQAQTQLGLSQSRLSKGITHQQRKIRTGNLSLD